VRRAAVEIGDPRLGEIRLAGSVRPMQLPYIFQRQPFAWFRDDVLAVARNVDKVFTMGSLQRCIRMT
jgi:hypothetical protein